MSCKQRPLHNVKLKPKPISRSTKIEIIIGNIAQIKAA